jgi:dTDP-glucose 4,6-dehydratase
VRLFVTGGAGFIGSNFIRYLLGLGKDIEVVNYDKLTYAGNLTNLGNLAEDPHYLFVKGDICDRSATEAAMKSCDAVANFAAESHVDRSVYEPTACIETNVMGTGVLLEAARRTGVGRFVQVSTDEVYGPLGPGTRADERAVLRPTSPYAASKAAADLLVGSFVRTYGFPAVITRSSNNYGEYQFPEKFIPLMVTNALESKPLPIYGDGRQQRDWLFVEDNCRGIFSVLERGRVGEIYNIGSGEVHENLSIAKRLLHMMDKPETLIAHVQDRPGHDRRYSVDCRKIEKELGWKPMVSLEEGLWQTIEWYKTNSHWLAAVRDGEYLQYYEKYYHNRDASPRDLSRTARDRH